MLLLASLGFAADLTVDLTMNATHHAITFADVHVGALPSVILADATGEVRVDLNVLAFDLETTTLTYAVTRLGKKPKALYSGKASGGGTSLPAIMEGMGGSESFQLLAFAAPTGGFVEAGPLGGCQWQRQLGFTDVVCPAGQIRHHRIEETSLAEIEAGVARAKASPQVASATGQKVSLSIGGKASEAYEVVVTPVNGVRAVTVIAWLGRDGKDEVRCTADDEATAVRYLDSFAAGLPAELR
ncbi:hypothetical protein LBMAG42_44150 [Deltaproteobacteria bacterium]|nr:hypothetical protein LBMAG42_44150 [Deltaproteobacteria bacterium]